MTKKSTLKTILIPLAAIAAAYGAVTFVGCTSSNDNPPPPPAAFKGNVFLDSSTGGLLTDSLGAANRLNYKFMHNSVSPDGTKMFVVFNKADAPMGATSGGLLMYMLNATELEKGNVVKLAEASITGDANTITFRSNWTPDGTKIALGGLDRAYVINASDLSVAGYATIPLGADGVTQAQNHDALPTTDGAYALLTLNTPYDAGGGTWHGNGALQLMNLSTHQLVGSPVYVCTKCHTGFDATLCGIDGRVSLSGSTYSGTVYVAGEGGHIAKVPVTIDPSTAPYITVNTASETKIDVTTEKLHDVRLDGTTIYWSSFSLDTAGKAHYGKINTDGSGKVDITVDPDARATAPTMAAGAWPIYCASGQTSTAFMPATMTNEAYITVIPKSDIHN